MNETNGLKSKLITVTPEDAAGYLATAKTVRTPTKSTVQMYARDMEKGRWATNHQGIAFDDDGHLVDGRHRMEAVVKSGVTIKIMATYGVSRDQLKNIDVGQSRSLRQTSEFLGYDNNRTVPVLKAFVMKFTETCRMSPGDIESIYQLHKDAIDFGIAVTSPSDNKYYHPTVMAAILARAFYSQDKERLYMFAQLVSGREETEVVTEQQPVILRKWYLERPFRSTGQGGMREIWQKTEIALCYFLQGRVIRQLKGKREELFNIPTENGVATS